MSVVVRLVGNRSIIFLSLLDEIFGFNELGAADTPGPRQNLEPKALTGKILRKKELALDFKSRRLARVSNR
jgi:hypothetical protein